MPDLLALRAKAVLDRAGADIVSQTRKSLSEKGITKSGKTAASLRNNTKENYTLEVWGREDMDNVESGVSPQQARKKSFSDLAPALYEWSKYLPLEFSTGKKRMAFANNVGHKLQEVGSKLYRSGGRTDIYTDKANAAIKQIADELATEILNYQIL